MLIKLLKPHALNLGEDYKYIATFCKGKGKLTLEKMRILCKGVKTGKEIFLGLEGRENFFGRTLSYQVFTIDVSEWVTPDHAKGEKKMYNYYRVSSNISTVDEFFTAWLNSDPMVHIGNYTHQFVTAIKDYKGAYEFNNKVY